MRITAKHRSFCTLTLALGLAALSACNSLDELWARAQQTDAATDEPTLDDGSAPHAREHRVGAAPSANGPVDPTHGAGSESEREQELAAANAPDDAGLTDATPAGDAVLGADASADDAAGGDAALPPELTPGPTITATWVWVPVYERPDGRSPRAGYLRGGAMVRVDPNRVGTDGCPRGWYRMLAGGYVCLNRMTTLDPNELGPRRPTQPDLAQAMPYPYMTTYRPTVMYRWLPSVADMREVEPERFAPPQANARTVASAAPSAAPSAANGESPADRNAPRTAVVAASDIAAGILSTGIPTENGSVNARASAAPSAAPSASANAASTVANRAQAEDAGVRLEDLQGESGSPLLRRMLSGMYISVDREVSSAGRRFWRTQNGGYVERGAVSPLRSPPTFQGVVLDAAHPLPMAFMTAWEGWTYDITPDQRAVARRERAPRLTAYSLTSDPPVTVARQQYYRTTGGFYVSARNIRLVRTTDPPADLGLNEKWIEVNLDRQMLIAYEGSRPVYVTLVSTGRRNERAQDRNYETVQGFFRIQSKHIATTMDGNSAGDGPYSIEDVPWVMYFENSFALHGAFWHSLFGNMRSHGCVNMSPPDARWVFNWTEPSLPVGWHGVNATASRPGTRVYVHYESQALGERGGPRVVPQH